MAKGSSSRNLSKEELGGVIFGCKNTTIQECLSKLLFGLPSDQFSYVRNIGEGLPVFLFNYSDRKLHGIYEAFSSGKMNIDPYAYTGGIKKTPCPAQVQVRVRLRCEALAEEEFKAIIEDNYYTDSHFRFELDHVQVIKLTSKFSALAMASRVYPLPLNTYPWSPIHDGNERERELYTQLTEMILNREGAIAKEQEQLETPVSDKNEATSDETYSPLIKQLLDEVAELNAFKTEYTRNVCTLEHKLAEAEQKIHGLKRQFKRLRSLKNSRTAEHGIGMVDESENEIEMEISDSIMLVGGYDGVDRLSALDLYSPSLDLVKSLHPMNFVRSSGSVAKLNGELYAFGGGNGSLWYDTVESYNPVENKWTLRPSMKEKKGSLGGVTVGDKIYALGGGNGLECFSAVEFFDPYAGCWIPTQSMRQRRFALAATDLNGAIYAVGGFDGTNILSSAERFDPREHCWSKIESMSTSRSGHSLIVMNEKLYSLGGYNGSSMVQSVEIYDPRLGKWSVGEAMDQPRGYLSAAVLKDTLYVIGGVKSANELVETVECYKEGEGWKTSILNAVGSRCFSSTIVLTEE